MSRVLVFTNVYDEKDDLLGYLPGRMRALADSLKAIVIVAQRVGIFVTSPRIVVHEVPKRKHPGRVGRVVRIWRLLWRQRTSYDSILVTMAPGWVIAMWPVAVLLGKPIDLWYAVWRGSVKLRVATVLCRRVITSVPEAFPFREGKVVAVGQGIDVDTFSPGGHRTKGQLLFVGRISPVKKIDVLFGALADLPADVSWTLNLIGLPVQPSDEEYSDWLKSQATRLGIDSRTKWLGKVPHNEVSRHYRESDVFVNLTPVGSFDKAALEAMASGLLVITTNRSLARFFSEKDRSLLFASESMLSERLRNVLSLSSEETESIRTRLRKSIIEHHSQEQWIKKVAQALA